MKPSPYSLHYNTLRLWLKSKREEKGMSLRSLADILGRHHSVVGKLEQDRRRIDVIEYIEYCEAVDADPREGIEILISSMKGQANKKS
ncbi:helix-turn-helix transcriptional regulator [Sedimenticola selenatireducens]|uniref:helix-turn-helix domain-containing protein n=1 Tax=Sedimenticola selenatireducens TaxID=191960 RepID=UPI002AABAC37|nr:helix-turn-helix transcriptional regulator [Sedimenticola selenatireducens]